MTTQKETRPACLLGGFSGDQDTDSLSPRIPVLAAEPLARALDGVFVAVVVMPNDRVRRRVFLSLHAAQRHADAARHAGREVHVYLAELAPVGEVAA